MSLLLFLHSDTEGVFTAYSMHFLFFFHPWTIHTFLKLTCIIYSTWFKLFTCIICICFWTCMYVEQLILWTSFHFKSSFSIAKNCYSIVWSFILILNLCPITCYIVIYMCVCVCVFIHLKSRQGIIFRITPRRRITR